MLKAFRWGCNFVIVLCGWFACFCILSFWFCCVVPFGCEKLSLFCTLFTSFWLTFVEEAILCRVMACVPDKIKSIDGSRETLKLAVRIADLWFIGIPDKSEQGEMVIVDPNGDEIHVVCKQDQLKFWKADLKENSTYVMYNFKVMNNNGQFRVCDHQYKLALGNPIWITCLLRNLNLLTFLLSLLLVISKLDCWLVSSARICALVLIKKL
ncbi:hypothetical protein HKD37_19G052624 [Glycine soja]